MEYGLAQVCIVQLNIQRGCVVTCIPYLKHVFVLN